MEKTACLLFIDFEFTMPEDKDKPYGFFSEIIETGIVFVQDGHIHSQYSSYVQPNEFPVLTNRCKKFLGIDESMLEQGISFKELISLLEQYNQLGNPTVITWGNMDMKVLRHTCEMAGLPFPLEGKQIDLSMQYKKFFGDRNQTGLRKAVQQYGNQGTGQHHRALDDALTTYEIYQLIEKDKTYLNNYKVTKIGDLFDIDEVWRKFTS